MEFVPPLAAVVQGMFVSFRIYFVFKLFLFLAKLVVLRLSTLFGWSREAEVAFIECILFRFIVLMYRCLFSL